MSKPFQNRKDDARNTRRAREDAACAPRNGFAGDNAIVFERGLRRPNFSLGGFCTLLLGFILFKAVVFTHLGAEQYSQILTELRSGSVFDQAGAFIMNVDFATRFFATELFPHFY